MAEAKFDFIRYANCWEDPENLLRALDIKDRRGASVLSAGDNVFALLTADPAHITAFDVNPTQIHLFHLKKAGIKALGYEDLLRLLGVVKSRRAYALFLSLENIMDKAAFDYFCSTRNFSKKGSYTSESLSIIFKSSAAGSFRCSRPKSASHGSPPFGTSANRRNITPR